jgi:hypothetical protein
MRRKLLSALLSALMLVSLTFGSVWAGNIHITGSTSAQVGSLTINAQVAGLGGAGVNTIYARFTAHGICNYPNGAPFTVAGTTSAPVVNGNTHFSITVNSPCGGEVWTSALLEVFGDADMTDLLDSQAYTCSCKFSNKAGMWVTTCREAR